MLAQSESRNQWYILRGETKYGPFEYGAMIRMLQTNELYDYNYVWAPHLDSWTLLNEIPDFSRDRLARLIENNADVKSAFITRKAPRVDRTIPIYGHNNHLFFDGHSLSLSESGALLMLNTPLLLPGQDLLIHFREDERNPQAFNATAQIVRKNFTRSRLNVKSGLQYAIKFVQVSPVGREALQSFVQEQSKEDNK
jgi:hypothetical protein